MKFRGHIPPRPMPEPNLEKITPCAERPLEMTSKLTPRQNELISDALCQIAIELCGSSSAPETLTTLRRALVSELEAVTSETAISPDGALWKRVCETDGALWKRVCETEDSKDFHAYWESMVTGSAVPEPTLESVKEQLLESGGGLLSAEAPQIDRAL